MSVFKQAVHGLMDGISCPGLSTELIINLYTPRLAPDLYFVLMVKSTAKVDDLN
jgi:hypothetical protein